MGGLLRCEAGRDRLVADSEAYCNRVQRGGSGVSGNTYLNFELAVVKEMVATVREGLRCLFYGFEVEEGETERQILAGHRIRQGNHIPFALPTILEQRHSHPAKPGRLRLLCLVLENRLGIVIRKLLLLLLFIVIVILTPTFTFTSTLIPLTTLLSTLALTLLTLLSPLQRLRRIPLDKIPDRFLRRIERQVAEEERCAGIVRLRFGKGTRRDGGDGFRGTGVGFGAVVVAYDAG